MLQALIFDVDGTLAETEEAHRQAFNTAFAEAGVGWHWDQPRYKALLQVTGGKERIARFIADEQPPDAPASAQQAEWIARLHIRKTAIYTGLVAEGHVSLRPGIAELLVAARSQGVRLAIATTTNLPNVESLLVTSLGPDAMGWFEAIAAGDAVKRKKPAPDVFELALLQLGLPARACLALEDSTNGLDSALGAGIPTVVTRSVYTDDQQFVGAVSVVESLADLVTDDVTGAELGGRLLDELRALHNSLGAAG
ncbi:MAG: HAD-IA family hydrolase [Hyphomicrobiaceae bacterium]|nr:HAD-IA family hydrolase [Hyphomicrobiaceae bacterium]